MKTTFVTLSLLIFFQYSFSQNVPPTASPLWAGTPIAGTARTVGIAGACGSVGADMGCIEVNPAGLGLYRSTDFSITPLLQFGNNESVYDGNHTLSHKTSFALAQGGFVFTKIFKKPTDDELHQRVVRTFSFALNFQQQNIFDHVQQYKATNTTSMIDNYAQQLNYYNLTPDYFPPEVQIASAAGLIGQATNGTYTSNVKGPASQIGTIEEKGGINRIDMGFGLNLIDKLYLGVNLAVPIMGYQINNTFYESPNTPQANGIADYTTTTSQQDAGVGFNGIIGLIYRPLPWMRLGAAYHLPTWYAMHEDYQITLVEDSSLYTTSYGPASLPTFQYTLRTPMKGDFGASFYLKEHGFISVDYSFQNLGATMIHVPNDSFNYEPFYNQGVKTTYGYQHTVHAGVEAAIKVVRLRAGYAYSSSPYKKGQEVTPGYTGAKNAFSGGIGVRLKHFYADLAYVYSWSKDGSYQLSNNLPVNSIYNSSTLLLTLGWKFESGAANKTKKSTQDIEPKRYTPPVDDQRY